MRNIVDIGKKGGERLTDLALPHVELRVDDPFLQMRLAAIRKVRPVTIQSEGPDGTKRPIEVIPLPLRNERVFNFVHDIAPYGPMLYSSVGKRKGEDADLGMVSPNFDTSGQERLPSIKIIPLRIAYPLTSKLQPNALMATMLAGATELESQGIGSEERARVDPEHRVTLLGAISLNNPSVALSHQNHEVRGGYVDRASGLAVPASSVATGLTDGRLGTLYSPDSDDPEFSGYGNPVNVHQGGATATDTLWYPKSFLDGDAAFGISYSDASRIMIGAGLQRLYGEDLKHRDIVNSQLESLGAQI